ncbi:hypothetical protein LEP1GSC058_0156 [Leptospira fainei serovar Hurstbridge str. BUT 6]|uniref:Uncharacterized protein n=1 Tax=Leptospira fainei serovar Hurstbridge str. BUT 6 TaxID=1193011 RepID=S3VF83_9LEPT|nr:hypothetical protein LEP1GSC058_0156 [Leptospira fainei serovar Hurstbridge str. BUT 6]
MFLPHIASCLLKEGGSFAFWETIFLAPFFVEVIFVFGSERAEKSIPNLRNWNLCEKI